MIVNDPETTSVRETHRMLIVPDIHRGGEPFREFIIAGTLRAEMLTGREWSSHSRHFQLHELS